MWSDDFWLAAAVLGLAAFLDYGIGDPWNWPHPVRYMGGAIAFLSRLILKSIDSSRQQRLAGVGLGLLLILGSGVIGWLIIWGAATLHPWLGFSVASILVASSLAARSLRAAAEDVLQPLSNGNLAQARQQLGLYVGRDTADLSEPEMLRAIFETVTENATDGVTAPLFYAILGAFLPGVGSVPLVLAYKAASTLDSMVGYRRPPYTHLGWFSARLEDGLTWLPCRLTVLSLALLSGRPYQIWQICARDAIADPSPNAGWSECAYAAVLGVQVGGMNRYDGVIRSKPLLGDPIHPITPARIRQALGLTRQIIWLWLSGAIATLISLELLLP